MKPGATIRPSASIVADAASSISPTSTTRPSRTPTSARTPGAPLPSTTVPPLTRTSSMAASRTRGGSSYLTPRQVRPGRSPGSGLAGSVEAGLGVHDAGDVHHEEGGVGAGAGRVGVGDHPLAGRARGERHAVGAGRDAEAGIGVTGEGADAAARRARVDELEAHRSEVRGTVVRDQEVRRAV